MSDKGKLSATTSGEAQADAPTDQRGTDVPEVYGAAAPDYFRAGWQPLPLPPGRKHAPPSGYTGAEGKMIGSIQTIKAWARNPKVAAGNVGLHLLHPFIGIDVDDHGEGDEAKVGASTLAAAQAELGALPPTLISSARPDPLRSGIRVYRLPPGSPRLTPGAEGLLTSRFGPDIDVISQAYRYIVVAPSTNPDADGAPYRWYVQHEVYEDGSGGQVEQIDGVPDFATVAELPQAWADLLTSDSGKAGAADDGRAQARAQAVERALGPVPTVDPFDPDDAELLDLDIDVASGVERIYSRERAEAEIGERLDLVRASRRGRINHTLKDAVTFLWHFVPHFLTQQQAVDLLLDAQRDAWVRSGGKDDGDYSGAMQTINHTVNTYIPTQIKFGQWWVAVPDEDDDEGAEVVAGKASAAPTNGATNATNAQVSPTNALDDEDEDDPTEIDEWDGPSASRSSSAGSTPSAASSGRDDVSEADRADIEATARLREQRRAEKAAKVEAEQLAEMLRAERLRRKVRRQLDEEEASVTVDAAAVSAFAAVAKTEADLRELPPPSWVVGGDPEHPQADNGIFYEDSVARIIGAGGTYKTFIMLSVASHVARGLTWYGRAVSQGPVVYVMAESSRGAMKRLSALRQWHASREDADPSWSQESRDLIVIDRPVQMVGAEWPLFVAYCAQIGARMVVLDTQAKMTVGLEENSAKDTGLWVAAAEELRRATKACVVLVHHTGHANGGRGRGSSAAYAGIDTELIVEPDGDDGKRRVGFRIIRQKEGDTWSKPEVMKLVEVGDSLALANLDAEDKTDRDEDNRKIKAAIAERAMRAEQDTAEQVLMVLADVAPGVGFLTKPDVLLRLNGARESAGLKPKATKNERSTVYKALDRLIERGFVQINEGGSRFAWTKAGADDLGLPYVPPPWLSGPGAEDDDDLGVQAGIDAAQEALDRAIVEDPTDDIEFE